MGTWMKPPRTATKVQLVSEEARRPGLVPSALRLRLTCAVIGTLELSPSAATSLLKVSPFLPVAVTGPATAAHAWRFQAQTHHLSTQRVSLSPLCFGQRPPSFLVDHFCGVWNVTQSPVFSQRPADSHTRPGGFLPPQPILPAVTLSGLAPGEGWVRLGP